MLAIVLAGPLATVQALDCYTCTSAESLACGTLRNHTIGGVGELPSVTCASDVHACRVQITSAGHIERGCDATPQQCSGDQCSSCTADKCNGQRYPAGGLLCVQCSGAQCASGVQEALPCPVHAVADTCYSAFSKGKTGRDWRQSSETQCMYNDTPDLQMARPSTVAAWPPTAAKRAANCAPPSAASV